MMLKFSVNEGIYGKESLKKSITRIANFGYDGVELAGEPHILKVKNVTNLLEAFGLEISSICGIYTIDRDLSNTDSLKRADGIQYVKDCITFASDLNAKIVIVVPSPIGKKRSTIPLFEEWKLACESIYELGQFAADLGVQLVVEALNRYETYLVNKIGQALKLCNEVGLETVGVMIDTFHMNIEDNSIPDAIRKIGNKLFHVHIADSNREAAGFGHIDFNSILKALIEINYNGYITMEFVTPKSEMFGKNTSLSGNEMFNLHTSQSINHIKKTLSQILTPTHIEV